MGVFSALRDDLIRMAKAVERAETRLTHAPRDPAAWLRERLHDQEFVLFAGAGISVPPPASAPTFVDLRNGVVRALADLLLERGVLDAAHVTAVEHALRALEGRSDLTLPPEHVFGLAKRPLGFERVSQLLVASLARGAPNANHTAIRRLIRPEGARLAGVVTPNFDTYLEQALEGIPLRRTVVDFVEGEQGFPLLKPHGSLERPDSIAITIDRVARPLRGIARESIRELAAGQIVVVIGYSGWDYDLFPLLVHAGREWGAELVWLLFDDASLNERAASIQLAVEERCTVLNGRRRPLLPIITGGADAPGITVPNELRSAFCDILTSASDDALAAALIGLVTPSGVPEAAGVVGALCTVILRNAEAGGMGDEPRLERLGLVTAWSSDPTERARAAQLAVESARRLGRDAAVLAFSRLLDGEQDRADPASRLERVERDLVEFRFALDEEPDAALAERSIRTDLLTSKASLLMNLRRTREAEELARAVLEKTTFPSSGIDPDAWIVADGYQRWKLHSILATAAALRGADDTAETEHRNAIAVLWDELQFWELSDALGHVAADAARRDRECLEAATALDVAVARFARDPLSELHALERKLDYGVGTGADADAATALLENVRIDDDGVQRHHETLERLRRRARSSG
jgi:hypothetical protein